MYPFGSAPLLDDDEVLTPAGRADKSMAAAADVVLWDDDAAVLAGSAPAVGAIRERAA